MSKEKKGTKFTNYGYRTISSLLYTGGRICVAGNESFFVCVCEKTVNFVEYSTGEVIHTLSHLENDIVSLSLSADDKKLAISLGNGDVQVYSTITNRILRVLHFTNPAVQLVFHPNSSYLALGFGNGLVRVYDYDNSKIIFNFSNHIGRIGMLKWSLVDNLLFSSSIKGLVASNLSNGKSNLLKNQAGVVLGLCFVEGGKKFLTSTGDKMLWLYSTENLLLEKKFPCYEDAVDIVTIPKEWMAGKKSSIKEISEEYQSLPQDLVVTGTRNGNIIIWNYETQKPVFKYVPTDEKSNNPCFQFNYVIKSNHELLLTTEDCNFVIFSFKQRPLEKVRTIFGFDEEIMDIVRLGHSSFATVSTGYEDIFIFDGKSKKVDSLIGHTDIVFSLASSSDFKYLASGGKDRTVRIWDLENKRCLGISDYHTDSITCLRFSQDNSFFVSGSDDRTIKLYKMVECWSVAKNWDKNKSEVPISISVASQIMGHRKSVTDLDISPDGKMLASSSSDKTVKLYKILRSENNNNIRLENFKIMNHPKGVWCVKFSSYEKVFVTGGADKNIRIWSVSTGLCLKLFEGHSSSVLKVDFVNFGTQLVSTTSSGVMKLWIIKTASCVNTFEAHTGSVWGLDVSKDDGGRIWLTCGEDSKILSWNENSKETSSELSKEKIQKVEKIQDLENFLREEKFGKALTLSIELDQPRRTYKILEKMLHQNKKDEILTIIKKTLGHQEINYLLQYCVDWNTNSRYCHVSSFILKSFFSQYDPSFIGWNFGKSLDSLLVYGNKHIKRLDQLISNSFVLDYTLSNMNIVQENESTNNDQNNSNSMKRKREVIEEEEEEVFENDNNSEPAKKKRKI